jgi:hypothetical protein
LNENDARRVADLLAARDEIEDWLVSLRASVTEHPESRMISFGDVAVLKPNRESEERDGWEGDLRVPRDIGIRMLEWARDQAMVALGRLGVELDAESAEETT